MTAAHLDTHIAVWLFSGDTKRLTSTAKREISRSDLLVSPMVMLELSLLHEIGRVGYSPTDIVSAIRTQFGVEIASDPFEQVTLAATKLAFTRDPFDRVITAQASLNKRRLITADATIRDHYANAVW